MEYHKVWFFNAQMSNRFFLPGTWNRRTLQMLFLKDEWCVLRSFQKDYKDDDDYYYYYYHYDDDDDDDDDDDGAFRQLSSNEMRFSFFRNGWSQHPSKVGGNRGGSAWSRESPLP